MRQKAGCFGSFYCFLKGRRSRMEEEERRLRPALQKL